MENQADATLIGGAFGRDSAGQLSEVDELEPQPVEERPVELKRIDALRIPVGSNLADVERWMIFATLQKCGGNKTRAAALLGVSLKTLYNRLNAYRAQGLTMDYDEAAGRAEEGDGRQDSRDIGSRSRGLHGNLTETQ